MVRDIQTFVVTVPTGGSAANPQKFAMTMNARIVRGVEIIIPDGNRGVLNFALGANNTPMIPSNAGAYIIGNDEKIKWDLEGFITSGAWQLLAYNTGTLSHLLHVRFLLDFPWSVRVPQAVPLLSNAELGSGVLGPVDTGSVTVPLSGGGSIDVPVTGAGGAIGLPPIGAGGGHVSLGGVPAHVPPLVGGGSGGGVPPTVVLPEPVIYAAYIGPQQAFWRIELAGVGMTPGDTVFPTVDGQAIGSVGATPTGTWNVRYFREQSRGGGTLHLAAHDQHGRVALLDWPFMP